jgi:hypothetical protein
MGRSWATSLPATTPPIVGASLTHLPCGRRRKRQRCTTANVPNIDGTWIIPTESPKGEHAWRLVIRQNGEEVSATILRVDGDTGTLHGSYQDGRFIVSHFQEVRPAMLEITPERDNTLTLKVLLHPSERSPRNPLRPVARG